MGIHNFIIKYLFYKVINFLEKKYYIVFLDFDVKFSLKKTNYKMNPSTITNQKLIITIFYKLKKK